MSRFPTARICRGSPETPVSYRCAELLPQAGGVGGDTRRAPDRHSSEISCREDTERGWLLGYDKKPGRWWWRMPSKQASRKSSFRCLQVVANRKTSRSVWGWKNLRTQMGGRGNSSTKNSFEGPATDCIRRSAASRLAGGAILAQHRTRA